MEKQLKKPIWIKFLPAFISNKLSESHDLLLMLNNSGWLLFDKLVRMVSGLLVSALVARYLGPYQYGQLAYVLAFLAFFQAVSGLGMDGIIVRDIAKNVNESSVILGTALLLRLVTGLLCWSLSVVLMALMSGWGDQSVYITATAGAVLVFQGADTVDLWFQSQSQSRRTVLVKLSAYVVSNGVKIILILTHAPILAFAAVIALDALVVACGLIYAYQFFSCNKSWAVSSALAKRLLKESWPFILSGISTMIYMRVDQLMIKQMLGEKALGIYAAVLPLSMIWCFIPMTLSVSLAPLVARKKREGDRAYWAVLNEIFRYFSILGWLVCIPISIFAPFIVNLLFGSEFSCGGKVLSIVIFCNLFINIGVAQSLWILNEKKSILSLYKTISGALVCVIANIYFIPWLGLVGAAISAVLAQCISAFLANIILCREIFYVQINSIFFTRFGK